MRSALLVALTILFFASGCQGPWTPRGFSRADDERVQLMHRDLLGKIRVDDIVSDYTIDGRLWAKAKIRNKSAQQLHLLVRTTFKDRSNNDVGEEAEWQTILIQPHETYNYNRRALNPDAAEYRIEINKGTSY